jgi:hypothetical protein
MEILKKPTHWDGLIAQVRSHFSGRLNNDPGSDDMLSVNVVDYADDGITERPIYRITPETLLAIDSRLQVAEQRVAELEEEMMEVDEKRLDFPSTGITVKARMPTGGWVNADINQLTRRSLQVWMRSELSPRLENVLGAIMGHGRLSDG